MNHFKKFYNIIESTEGFHIGLFYEKKKKNQSLGIAWDMILKKALCKGS